MGSEELAANLFRITQTESRLKRDKVDTEKKACDTHNKIGKTVRKAKILIIFAIFIDYFYKVKLEIYRKICYDKEHKGREKDGKKDCTTKI